LTVLRDLLAAIFAYEEGEGVDFLQETQLPTPTPGTIELGTILLFLPDLAVMVLHKFLAKQFNLQDQKLMNLQIHSTIGELSILFLLC